MTHFVYVDGDTVVTARQPPRVASRDADEARARCIAAWRRVGVATGQFVAAASERAAAVSRR